MQVIGKSIPKIDSYAKVTGAAKYADDLQLPRMAYGRILRSPHPHARVLRIDTEAARSIPGVLDIITGADLFGRLLQVSMDDPPAVMHWTYPIPAVVKGSANIYTLHDLVPLR